MSRFLLPQLAPSLESKVWRIDSRWGRSVALTTVVSLVMATIPGLALAAEKPVRELSTKAATFLDQKSEPLPPSRILAAKTMREAQGRTGENPYLAGQAKWDAVYKGIDLVTGNYSTSGTDLTFEGGYGIPVNVTRSYSANNPDEGPLGKGWTLSVDVRSTAGGVMKSAGAPVRAVPTAFKEKPSLQSDPNAEAANGDLAAQPVEGVTATDAGGTEETVQRDADGVLSTPPWDKNTNDTVYENVVQNDGSIRRRTVSNTVHTPDGTTYVYQRLGTYPNGMTPYNQTTAAAEPSDVLKIVSATDRQGNVTTYGYGANDVSFTKSNGTVNEKPLTYIQMPNGHRITFTWSGNRIVSADDHVPNVTGTYRTVQYGYTNGLLTSVTTPAGKATTYGWSIPAVPSGWSYDTAGYVLSSVTDPRGLTTSMYSTMQLVSPSPYYYNQGAAWVPGVVTYRIVQPNAVELWVCNSGTGVPGSSPHSGMESGTQLAPWWQEYANNDDSKPVAHGYFRAVGSGLVVTVMKSVGDADQGSPTNTYPQLPFPGVVSYDNFDAETQNLMLSHRTTRPYSYGSLEGARLMNVSDTDRWVSDLTTSYNFMGNPLKKTAVASSYPTASPTTASTQTNIVEYAYWGANKYYQQKIVRDEGASYGTDDRLSYTDYYTSSAAAGSLGQTSKVYDAKNTPLTAYTLDTSIPLPYGVDPAGPNVWKYRLRPTNDTHAAEFQYDAKGRPVDVWKVRTAPTSGPFTYVQTHTTYGTDTDGSWGGQWSVVEDSGGIGRTTLTSAYDAMGRAVTVQDASGQTLHTTYDLDGVVQSVEKVVNGVSTPIVSYVYGTTANTLAFGQVLTITDGLSGVVQSFGYVPSGGGKGQVSGVIESGGPSPSYEVDYTYSSAGDRATSTYVTPQGTTAWGYSDYVSLGEPTSRTRVFRTMARLNPTTLAPTAEEFHYAYDADGKLRDAAFAQTPSAASASANGWYRNSSNAPVPAATRARAHYEYDMGGRTASVAYWWDALNSGGTAYGTPTPIRANACDYETAGLSRGLKTASYSYTPNGSAWTLARTETYGYDAANDQLTGASYGDGLAGANPAWTYDAAGNRISDSTNSGAWSYDNLNRMTASPQGSCANDVLGNRLIGQGKSCSWDSLGRMRSCSLVIGPNSFTIGNGYVYRADGMRVEKNSNSFDDGTGQPMGANETYRYDGQMPIETVTLDGATVTATERRGVGARGLDMIERTTSSGTVTGFPLYDAHGNNVGTLTRPTTSGGQPGIGDERTYDAWGQVRQGSGTGAPTNRYCARIGHVQDDESGLVYMRARYYEPGTGRFLSEDRARDGVNWYSYCLNQPVNKVDRTGNFTLVEMIDTATEYAVEFNKEFQTKMAALGAAGTTIATILEKYAAKYGEALGDDFELVFGSSNNSRVWITGIDRGKGFQVAIDFANGIVKAYGPSGQHSDLPPGVPGWEPFENLIR